MNRASVSEWHKRFKEGRESARDDETCGRSKEVKTPELIGQIKNFMDKDCQIRKEKLCHDNREMGELINSHPAVLNALVTCDESWIYCYDPETKRQSSQWKHAGSRRLKKARQSKSTHKLLMIPFFSQHWHDLHVLGSHWTDSQQGILCRDFKGVQEEIPRKEASTLQIGSVAFPPGQCTSPQLHPCHRLFDQDGHKDSSSAPYSSDLAPCHF